MDNKTTPQDSLPVDGTRERVTGPFNGYHVAALGCYVGGEGSGFRGFYKICRVHPACYWTAECTVQGRCGPEALTGASAMQMAESAAALQIQDRTANGGQRPEQRNLPEPHIPAAHLLTGRGRHEGEDEPSVAAVPAVAAITTKDLL